MYSLLIRALPYIVIFGSFIGASWWIIDASYEHGRKIERSAWIEREHKAQIEYDKKISQLDAKMETEREKADRRATQIFGAYADEIEKLNADLNSSYDKRLYITAKAAICKAGRDSMPSSNQSSSKPSSEVRFEIPEQTGRAIWQDYKYAAGIVIKHNMLIDLIESRPDCFEVVR